MINLDFIHRTSNYYLRFAEKISEVQIHEKFSHELATDHIDSQNAEQLFDALNVKSNRRCIYVIESIDLNVKRCFSAFMDAKAERKEYAFARMNVINDVFYVGSSLNLKSRLKNHLGLTSKKTYSLQLAQWISNIKGSLKFTVYYFKDEIEPEILQALEDALWRNLKPMFGKQGGR